MIASGSLLGINYKEVSSFPVGYERQFEMHLLDFEEYLLARGISKNLILELKNHFETFSPVEKSVNDKMQEYVREFMVVGGMPAVVNKFLETRNFNDAHAEQQKILDAYLNDIAKYAPTKEKLSIVVD